MECTRVPLTQLHAEHSNGNQDRTSEQRRVSGTTPDNSAEWKLGVLSNPTWLIIAPRVRDFRGRFGDEQREWHALQPGPVVHFSGQARQR
jgi:hypothetical protein